MSTNPESLERARAASRRYANKPWICPDCGHQGQMGNKSRHLRTCKAKQADAPMSTPGPKARSEAVEKAIRADPFEHLDPEPVKPIKTNEPVKPLKSRPESFPEYVDEVVSKVAVPSPEPYDEDEGEDKGSKSTVYLQLVALVGFVAIAAYFMYRIILGPGVLYGMISGQGQEVQQPEQPIDMGFTDSRGTYYAPGEYCHERRW